MQELKVIIEKDEEHDYMKFEFPEEEDRVLACFKLAQFAEIPETGIMADGHHVGYFRDIFMGVTGWHLYEIRTVVGEPTRFVFKERKGQDDEFANIVSLTKVSDTKIELIFKE